LKKKFGTFLFVFLLASLTCLAKIQRCPTGTLADVMGTTCTIGDITYTFGTDFHGFTTVDDQATNVFSTTFFGPDAIGFVPIASANQSGFQLVPNFVANTNGTGLFFVETLAKFSYGLQANDTSEVLSETVTIDGDITQTNFAFIQGFDVHTFNNQSFAQAGPTDIFAFGALAFNQPTVTSTLPEPGISAGIVNPDGSGFTTEFFAQAEGGDIANLRSSTFLYTTAPRVTTPPAGNFRFQSVDIPGESAIAQGINNLGQIVGNLQDSFGSTHGYVQDGLNLRQIDFPNATSTFAEALSNSGMVAGGYSDPFGGFHGYVLDGGTFASVDFPGAIFTEIFDINDQGDLTGVYQSPDFGIHGFIHDKNGFTSVDDPAQTFFFPSTEALGINNRGTVVGFFRDARSRAHGFSLFHELFQQIDVPGAISSVPEGLNESETIVGVYRDLDHTLHSYIQRGDNFTTLDFPGAVGTTAVFQINDQGTMLGNYIDDQGVTHSFIADQLPGSAQDTSGPNINPIVTGAPIQTCSPADWVRHPETMRVPKICHPGN
jgi:hypothetical protein